MWEPGTEVNYNYLRYLGVEEIMVITNHVTEVVINDHVTQGSICHKV